ncbi:cell division FtsA domain-containing protein [Natranaerofaba carboxydovora]|uniref:cell division FtsA domain-containing protein n=1 Tax=Natranaerofaba carboxydovora TaxID=2742683 RepID=UPI001F12D3B2|nr:cell division FtsA domain-containing protein [Natranaerofaba carboxydovora]UMZ75232.1 Cell division protein FtsA [Natranaerofaba carboxydovora]
MGSKKNLFALDIGTRNVVGLVYQPVADGIKIRSFSKKDHDVRCMFDGQIHDINEVAEVVKEVKNELEKKLNLKLDKVAIAAAGRSLMTERSFTEKERDNIQRIDSDEISALELQAVQKAQAKIKEKAAKEDNNAEHHCVGYSIINYYLNGHPISNLNSQKGNKIGVEVIATFLPQVVIDGLEGVMEEVGLKISSLTLEPIAAINLAIPKELRMLNLALIDIGAGTSDIAITKDGTVVAYQMVPIAGDEITEKICQELLVDFNTAEKVKLSLDKAKSEIRYKDVIGANKSIEKTKLMEIIQPPLDKLADSLAKAILEVNQTAPSAVFCIGGGSQLPTLDDKLAGYLELDKDRVTIKGDENWDKIKNLRKSLKGPGSVTPLGIALSSCKGKDLGFFYVTINGRLVRLFGKDQVKVADALLAAGYKMKKLIASTGKGIKIELNGVERYFPGNTGEPAKIMVNGETAGLETIVKNNDDIYIEEAKQGSTRRLKAKELYYEVESKYFYLNGEKVSFPYEVLMNGERILPEKQITDGSKIEIKILNKVEDLAKNLELDLDEFDLIWNTKVLDKEDIIENKAELLCKRRQTEGSDNDNFDDKSDEKKVDERSQDNDVLIIEVNGDELEIAKTKEPKFLDIFKYVGFDTSAKKGDLIMKINEEPAEFTSPIKNGDRLTIFWSEEGMKKLERLD